MTEQDIVTGCQHGDNAARKELYERFAGSMLSLCLRYTGNREEAEDVLQDGFIQVFTVIGRFAYRGEGSLTAWMRRVFTNHTLSYLEKERRVRFDDVERLPDTADDGTPPPGISAEEIVRLIGGLPSGYRTVLNLYLLEGWSHKEIAERLGIGESTSASQYLRGKKLLRQRITEYIRQRDEESDGTAF